MSSPSDPTFAWLERLRRADPVEQLRDDTDQRIADLWRYVLDQTEATSVALERMEQRMTNVEQQTWDELGRLVGVIVAEVTSLRDGIAQKDAALQAAQAELADAQSAAAQQVQDALDADSAADVERALGLVDQLKTAVPADVPDVPVPAPGEPAEEPPAGGGGDVPAEPAPGDQPTPNPDGSVDVINPTPNPDQPADQPAEGDSEVVDADGNPVPADEAPTDENGNPV